MALKLEAFECEVVVADIEIPVFPRVRFTPKTFTGYRYEEMMALLKNLGEFSTLRCPFRLVYQKSDEVDPSKKFLLLTPAAHKFFFNIKDIDINFEQVFLWYTNNPQKWHARTKSWTKFFWPITLVHGQDRDRTNDTCKDKKKDELVHIALVYFERKNSKDPIKLVYIDNLTRSVKKDKTWNPYQKEIQDIFGEITSRLGFKMEKVEVTWHVEKNFNQNKVPNPCSLYLLHVILTLLQTDYTADVFCRDLNLNLLLETRLDEFETCLGNLNGFIRK